MKVLIDKIDSYDLQKIIEVLRSHFEEIDFWNKLRTKNRILIKPNLLGPYAPEEAVTTHPVVIEAVIVLLKEQNKEIWLGDSPGGSVKVPKTWQKTGVASLAKQYNIKLVNFSEFGIKHSKAGNIDFVLTGILDQVDGIINISKYKTHSLMYYTGAIKNLYGLIPGLKKSDYHKEHADYKSFAKVISGLYSLVCNRIDLNIMDGIIGMEGDGPSAGIKRKFGVLFTSESASALDYTAAKMLGFKNTQLQYILDAMKYDDLEPDSIELTPEWSKFHFKNVRFKKLSFFIKLISVSPNWLKEIFKNVYKYEPDFNEKCVQCRICLNSCPVKAISLDDKMHIDYDKCIKCMCCHEFCPYHAVYIRKSWLARRIIK